MIQHPDFHARQRLPLVWGQTLLVGLWAMTLTCCAVWQPRLRAAWTPGVPLPNGLIETSLWDRARPLDIEVRRSGGEQRKVRMRAIHDGRAISFLVQWVDATDTLKHREWTVNGEPEKLDLVGRRIWVWNETKEIYELQEMPADQLAIMWPLADAQGRAPGSRAPQFGMLDGAEGAFDVWEWTAGWTDLSGFARDCRLMLTPHPASTAPDQVTGTLYNQRRGPGKVEVAWLEDSGHPGTVATERPDKFRNWRMPGARAQTSRGGAGDILAQGVYNPAVNQRPAYWFVEFHRLLVTESPQEDYQIRGRGPHWLALALFDNSVAGDHFASGAIRLEMEKTP
jgi:hypothetical protein